MMPSTGLEPILKSPLFTDSAALVTGALLAKKPRYQSLVRCWFRTNGVGCVDPQVVEHPANVLQLPLLGPKARALAPGAPTQVALMRQAVCCSRGSHPFGSRTRMATASTLL
jgi:hypothetical protein